MSYDREEFKAALTVKHAKAQQAMVATARLVSGAAPIMDKLARTDEWNRFGTYLQGVSQQFITSRQSAIDKLTDPSITKDEDVRKLRQDVFEADVWIRALRFAIELPAYILQGKVQADEFIATTEKKNENPT